MIRSPSGLSRFPLSPATESNPAVKENGGKPYSSRRAPKAKKRGGRKNRS